MEKYIQFFKKRLQFELPHSDIHKEGLDPKTLALLLEEEKNAKQRFLSHPPRICAVMIAFYQFEDDLFLPMMLRPKKSRAHPGQISFPGGKKEDNDLNLIATAIREMEEEIGVRVPEQNILGQLSAVYIPPSNSLVTPILGFLDTKPQYFPQPDEVEKVLDISIMELANPKNQKAKKVPLTNGDVFEMPAFDVNNNFIWGGTARMIMELNKLLDELLY
jgi:8-oxo-dGTP pyrophosphatase MutT (NUDIX family)